MNNEEEAEENYYQSIYCGATFDSEDERDSHTFEKHMDAVEEKLGQIRNIAEENKETIENWKDAKKKELLLKIATERPQLLHEIQTSPHADEILDKEIEMDLFKKALQTNSLSSFDAMWIRHPRFEEIYRASRQKPAHQPQIGDSTGQSEEFFEIPNSPEAEKVLEKKTPVNKVSFKDGKLILEPDYEPERLPGNVKYAGNRENLSEEDRHKMEMILVLQALLRKKKSN